METARTKESIITKCIVVDLQTWLKIHLIGNKTLIVLMISLILALFSTSGCNIASSALDMYDDSSSESCEDFIEEQYQDCLSNAEWANERTLCEEEYRRSISGCETQWD